MFGAFLRQALPTVIGWGSKLLKNTGIGQKISSFLNSNTGKTVGKLANIAHK